MAVATEDWSRPLFEPGGGDAFLFYLVFGELAPLRLPPTPSWLSLTVHPQGEARVWVEPLVEAIRDGNEGQPALVALVRRAPDFAVLRGQRPDPPNLAYLRDAESVLASLLEAGAAAVLDVEAQRWWTPSDFRREVLTGVRPAVCAHVSVRSRTGLVETRGLRKFGRPDLRLRGVPPDAQDEAVGFCWGLVKRMARGARLGPGVAAAGVSLRAGGEPGHPALEGEWPKCRVGRASTA
jgi:hypothetical protein